jgi:dipeptidyl aminopeptidase/acylaminoacyl peptidase
MRAAPFFVSFLLAAQWTPELSLQVKGVGSVVPSPDGTLVLWTETRALVDPEKSEMSSQIMLGKSDGSSRLALTSESRNASSPQWSFDGNSVYFKVKNQLFRIPVDGGESELLLDWKGNLGGVAPSPDGKQVAFTGSEERPDDEKAKKEKRDWKVIDAHPENHALWLIPAEGDAPRKAKKLVGPERHITEIDWSPDSKFLAYQHTTAKWKWRQGR